MKKNALNTKTVSAYKPKKVFISGASGMLGSTMHKIFVDEGIQVISTDLNPLDPWTDYLDVRDRTRVFEQITREKPDVVLNLAALTDLEYCETHIKDSFDTNALGAENVALVCHKLNIPLVHISTAGVFDGTKDTPYTEQDQPNALNVYGRSKYEAEKIIPKILKKYYIFRAGWMMGGAERDKKFVQKILNQIRSGKKIIPVVTDKMGCPTYTADLSRGILKMLGTKKYGLYHMVSEGNCSRFDVANKIIELLEMKDVSIVPATSSDIIISEEYFVPRAGSEVMINQRILDMELRVMRNWEDAIQEYLLEEIKPMLAARISRKKE